MFGPLVVKPGSSRKNKTGSWRIEATPKFLRKNCTGCKICMSVCPEGSILEGSEKNQFVCDYEFCKGCGVCAAACPKGEISMIREDSAGEKK